MKKVIFSVLLLMPLFAGAAYVNGDGTLDLICKDRNEASKPYNIFDLTLMYDDSTGKDGFDLISDENLSSGNGDVVYQIKATQFPYYGAEIPAVTQEVKGCSAAPLSMTMNEEGTAFELYFECDGDGDAGFGTITINTLTNAVEGKISFPEGQSQLLYPIVEDTDVEVRCEFKGMDYDLDLTS